MKAKDFNALVTPPCVCTFGAPMGRCNRNMLDVEEVAGYYFYEPVKKTTRRIPLDSGGYDKGGAYWGLGAPLYAEYSKDGRYIRYFRKE